jgi:hypothetical protein
MVRISSLCLGAYTRATPNPPRGNTATHMRLFPPSAVARRLGAHLGPSLLHGLNSRYRQILFRGVLENEDTRIPAACDHLPANGTGLGCAGGLAAPAWGSTYLYIPCCTYITLVTGKAVPWQSMRAEAASREGEAATGSARWVQGQRGSGDPP